MQTLTQRRRFQAFMKPRDHRGRFLPTGARLVHGTAAAYRRRCRCWDCRSAWAAYIRAYRVRRGFTHRSWGPVYHLTLRALDERRAQAGYVAALAAGEVP
jgi:hypothetical protein